MDEEPKVIVHEPCGNDLFLYFGSERDAKILRNMNDIATMDGEGISPDDILQCRHCGIDINTQHLRIGNPDVDESKRVKKIQDLETIQEMIQVMKNLDEGSIEKKVLEKMGIFIHVHK